MIDAKGVKPGDWIRFYSDGRLVIGVVQYVSKNVLGELEFHTDIGTTTGIWEVRYTDDNTVRKN